MQTYENLIDKYRGSVSFILGAGPSLFSFYRKNIYPSIKNNIIISVNSSIMILPWEIEGDPEKHFWISNDALCRNWSWWNNVLKAKCTKIVRNSWLKYKDELPGFIYFYPRPTSEDIVNPEDKGLCYCSSVVSALDLSLQMGSKKIFLLGVDQCLDKETKYHHYWQYFCHKNRPIQVTRAQGSWGQQEKVFKYNNMAYKALKGFSEYKKAEIYNCNLESEVDVFKKISLEDMLVLCQV